jgi:hypothetical protein
MKNFGLALMLAASATLLSTAVLGTPVVSQTSPLMGSNSDLALPNDRPSDSGAVVPSSVNFGGFGDFEEMIAPVVLLPFEPEATGFVAPEGAEFALWTGGLIETLSDPGFPLITATPEPASLLLLVTCLAGVTLIGWRMTPQRTHPYARRARPRSWRRYAR